MTDQGDPNANPGDYRVEIDWNDGILADGEITRNGSAYRINASRSFTKSGSFAATIYVFEGDRSRARGTATIDVTIAEDKKNNNNNNNNNGSGSGSGTGVDMHTNEGGYDYWYLGLPIWDYSVPGCPNMYQPWEHIHIDGTSHDDDGDDSDDDDDGKGGK